MKQIASLLALLVCVVAMPPAVRAGDDDVRQIRINGKELGRRHWRALAALERRTGQQVADGDYWYDARSGLAGAWGAPATAVLPAGLALPGPTPSDASFGSTGVYINGRELPDSEVALLQQVVGAIVPGRYWLDRHGNAGPVGGRAAVNLWRAAQAQRGRTTGYNRSVDNGNGSRSYIGSDGNTSYFFDGGTGCSVIPGEGVSC